MKRRALPIVAIISVQVGQNNTTISWNDRPRVLVGRDSLDVTFRVSLRSRTLLFKLNMNPIVIDRSDSISESNSSTPDTPRSHQVANLTHLKICMRNISPGDTELSMTFRYFEVVERASEAHVLFDLYDH